MCELYPTFKSCCGVSVRLAMIYIAILSIVTGTMINAALKKAGVNVASIDEVKNLKDPTGSNDATAKAKNSSLVILTFDETEEKEIKDIYPEPTVMELDDADAVTTTATTANTTTTTVRTTNTTVRTTTNKTTTTASLMDTVASVNRNGMNFLACAFIALGLLLLVANFMKSPELALVYVVASLTTTVSSLVLLVGVVGECAQARDSCLLRHIDWFSSFVVTLFWFLYIFVWLFFTGVANAFANGEYGAEERSTHDRV